MLLTRSPLIHPTQSQASAFDLHVLSTPNASVRPEPGSHSPNKNKTARKRTTHPPNNRKRATPTKKLKNKNRHKNKTKTVDKQTHYRVHKQHPHKPATPPQQGRTTSQAQPPRTTPRRQTNNLPTHPHHVKSIQNELAHKSYVPLARLGKIASDARRTAAREHPPPTSPTPSSPCANSPRPGNTPTGVVRLILHTDLVAITPGPAHTSWTGPRARAHPARNDPTQPSNRSG